MKALIIGATGFIGGAIVRAAVERGWQVHATRRADRRTGSVDDLSEQGRIEWHHAHLLDADALARAMEGCHAVFHAAGYYPTTSRDLPGQLRMARTQMETVLNAFRRAGPQVLVYTSSLSTIGPPSAPGRMADEGDVYRQGSAPVAYFDIKIVLEETALASGLPVVVVCPSAVFGPGDVKPTSGILVINVARGWMPFFVDGIHNVVDARDLATTQLAASEYGRPGQRYIVGGENMSFYEMLAIIAEQAGRHPPWVKLPAQLIEGAGAVAGWLGLLGGDILQGIRYWQALDTSRARAELGHTSRPFADTVRDSLVWFRAHRYL
jgi:dihydroflavonol-4-reductase